MYNEERQPRPKNEAAEYEDIEDSLSFSECDNPTCRNTGRRNLLSFTFKIQDMNSDKEIENNGWFCSPLCIEQFLQLKLLKM